MLAFVQLFDGASFFGAFTFIMKWGDVTEFFKTNGTILETKGTYYKDLLLNLQKDNHKTLECLFITISLLLFIIQFCFFFKTIVALVRKPK